MILTAHNRPIADIVPHSENRSPWVPARVLREIRREAPADSALLDDLAEVRGATIEAHG